MNFGYALDQMKKGFRMTRAGWSWKGMWIAIQMPDPNSEMSIPYIYMRTANNDLVPWLASQSDILAEDWYLQCLRLRCNDERYQEDSDLRHGSK